MSEPKTRRTKTSAQIVLKAAGPAIQVERGGHLYVENLTIYYTGEPPTEDEPKPGAAPKP